MTDIRRSLALLGVAAVIGALIAPMVAFVMWQKAEARPGLRDEEYRPGQVIDVFGIDGFDVWAQPADLDVSEVTCVGTARVGEWEKNLQGGPPKDGPETARDSRGTFTFLTIAGNDFTTSRVSCTGAGLEALAISEHIDRDTYRNLALGIPLTIPVFIVIAVLIHRTGVRISGEHHEPAASWRS